MLSADVKKFVEDNISLIEDCAWDSVYRNALEELSIECISELTQAILSIGEDPLDMLDYIPSYYLCDANIETFSIPDHIKYLSDGCFSNSTLKTITLPEGVREIGMNAFRDCWKLEECIIPPSVTYVYYNAFYPPSDKLTIVCKKGSYAEQYAINCNIKVKYY